MKLTPQQLRSIIQEEVRSARTRKGLTEAPRPRGGALFGVSAAELIAFAEAYSSLGADATDQLKTIIELGADADPDDINPAAIKEVVRTLRGINSEIDQALSAWQAANGRVGAPRRR